MLKSLPVQTFLTLPQAAKQLHVSDQTLRNWTEAGRIDAYLTEGDHRRYLIEDVRLLSLVERSKAEGKDKPYLFHLTTSVRRYGDKFVVSGYDEDKDEEYLVDFDKLTDKDLSCYKRALRASKMGEFKDYRRNGYQHTKDLDLLVTGEAQHTVYKMEFQNSYGSSNGIAYAEQCVSATGITEQEALAAAKQAMAVAKANLERDANPVYGICSYETASGETIAAVKF